MLPPGDITMIPLNWKLRPLPSHFGLLRPQNQYAKKGVTVLAGVTDADYQGKWDNYAIKEVKTSMWER